jgi:lactate permease
MSLSLTLLNWLLALAPVLAVVALMLVFRWGGSRAGGMGWILAIFVAAVFFGAGFELLAVAQVKAVLLSLDVLFIIWAALLLFNISREAGAIRMIGITLPRLTSDRVMQSLLIGWLMVSFIQGLGGFGVPVAVCAPMLVGLGYTPIQAVAMASLGDGWGVTFGSLGASFQSLMAVTGLSYEVLGPLSAILIGISGFPSGLLVVVIGNGWKSLKRALLPTLLLSGVMGVVQYFLVVNGLWTLGTTGASVVGLFVGFLLVRLPVFQNHASKSEAVTLPRANNGKEKSLWLSLLGYEILVVLAFAINLIPPLKSFLSQVVFSLEFPEVSTRYGWVTLAGPGRGIDLFTHPGAILLYSCIISFFIYRKIGYLKKGALKEILGSVAKSGVTSSLGILAMVGVASIMMHSGMTYLLAEGLSVSFSREIYPAIAPFIGALGAFITGSNTNSNVLFGALQLSAAELLNLSVPLILAAQTAGGSLGSVLAPAKVIVGSSTVGLAGEEGIVMRKLLIYGAITIGFVSMAALILHWIGS